MDDKLVQGISAALMIDFLIQSLQMDTFKKTLSGEAQNEAIKKMFDDQAKLFIEQIDRLGYSIVSKEVAAIPDAFRNF